MSLLSIANVEVPEVNVNRLESSANPSLFRMSSSIVGHVAVDSVDETLLVERIWLSSVV